MSEHTFVVRRAPFPEADARTAVAGAICWADALRTLGYRPIGHNYRTLQRWVKRWQISTEHFDAALARQRAVRRPRRALEEVMVRGSNYPRNSLKKRLYATGLKSRRCEVCGQDEYWQGRRMALILDHINGVGDDHRLENLRIVCPNCASTLETHCGRNLPRTRSCAGCGRTFAPKAIRHRYCSRECFYRQRPGPGAGIPRPHLRKVTRPPYEQLMREIEATGYEAVGRKYGVSGNAIRKWVRACEQAEAG